MHPVDGIAKMPQPMHGSPTTQCRSNERVKLLGWRGMSGLQRHDQHQGRKTSADHAIRHAYTSTLKKHVFEGKKGQRKQGMDDRC